MSTNRQGKGRLFIAHGALLTYLLGPGILILKFPSFAAAFDTFEHFYVGQVAYKRAFDQVCNESGISICSAALDPDKVANLFKNSGRPLTVRGRCPEETPPVTGILLYFTRIIHKPVHTFFFQEEGLSCADRDMAEFALGDIPIGFGDLSALGGDFTEKPSDLDHYISSMLTPQNKRELALLLATRRHLVNACEWLRQGSDSNTACQKILSEPHTERAGNDAYEMSRPEAASFEAIPGYVGLALQNQAHFATHSWKTYLCNHKKALDNAKQYHQANAKDLTALKNAILYEGFAQHFLQDSFASGHIGSMWGGFVPEIPVLKDIRHLNHLIGMWRPNRDVLESNHDYLNAHGLEVEILAPNTKYFIFAEDGGGASEPALRKASEQERKAREQERKALENALEKILKGTWTAYGDDSLLLMKAHTQREIVVDAATVSIAEVLNTASTGVLALNTAGGVASDISGGFVSPAPASSGEESCVLPPDAHEQVLGRFPVPTPELPNQPSSENAANGPAAGEPAELAKLKDEVSKKFGKDKFGKDKDEDLVSWPGCKLSWNFYWNCRSSDYRVPDYPVEGWKILVSAGATTGTFQELNSHLQPVGDKRHNIGTEIFEMGYVHATDPWFPNYFGAGVKVVNQFRTSLYPFSVGYWIPAPSRMYYLGFRANVGVRLEQPFQLNNRSTDQEASLEVSVPAEIGFNIYPPLAIFLRLELFNLNFTDFLASPWSLETASLLNGHTTVGGGIRWDLAGVL